MSQQKSDTTQKIELSLLGAFEMRSGDIMLDETATRSSRTWELFSYLALNRDRRVSLDELIKVFWDDGGKNPTSALKTLMHRARSVVFEYFGEDFNPVESFRGAYSWNSSILCSLDTEHFEEACEAAASVDGDWEKSLELYRSALELYRGHFLSRHGKNEWIDSLREKYRSLYVTALFSYADILMAHRRYDELVATMLNAAQTEPNNERLHSYIVIAHLRAGRSADALKYYKAATNQLYRSLGIRPSEYLQDAYTEIMRTHGDMETNIEVVQTALEERDTTEGAFFCELGFFKQAYQLESRLAERAGTCVNLALVNVTAEDGSLPPLDQLSRVMDNMLEVFTPLLRKGDVISKYSGAQYVIMLPTPTVEDGEAIMQRLIATFHSRYPRCPLVISYDIHPANIRL